MVAAPFWTDRSDFETGTPRNWRISEDSRQTLFRPFAFWYRPSVKHRIIGWWKRESAAAGRGRMLASLILFWVPVTLILILIGIAHFES